MDATPEQQAEENSVRFGLIGDAGLIVLIVLTGILGGSLTILAEAIRTCLMILSELFSFVVMRRIHRGQLADLEFGTGKLEQVANALIGASMLGGGIWIIVKAFGLLIGDRPVASAFGLTVAAIVGALNRPLLKSFSNQAGSARTAMAWIANPSGDAATRMIATAGSV